MVVNYDSPLYSNGWLARLEVEFPPVPGNTDGYKGASDLFIDSNCQLALAAAKQLAAVREQARRPIP